MPSPVNAQSTTDANPELRVVSNALDNMTSPGIGPEQSDCRVISCEYVHFDYNGTLKDDPIIAVKQILTPLDGSNEGKDFEIEWPTGAKAADFAIINNGGQLAMTAARATLSNNSNWALLLKSMADAGFDSKILDGDQGIGYLAGTEYTLRRVPQPTRSGLDAKNSKGYDKTYYTCLKILNLPGEKPKAGARRPSATAGRETVAIKPSDVAKVPASAVAGRAPAPKPAPATTNGSGAGSTTDITALITTVLANNGGSIPVADLAKAVFVAAKGQGISAKDCHALGQSAAAFVTDEDTFYTQIGEQGLSWTLESGVLASGVVNQ